MVIGSGFAKVFGLKLSVKVKIAFAYKANTPNGSGPSVSAGRKYPNRPPVLIVSKLGLERHSSAVPSEINFVLLANRLFTRGNVREMLSADEKARLDIWLRHQSETATFFFDSIDELELTLVSFEQALIRLQKAIAGQLGRAKIVITTRPVRST